MMTMRRLFLAATLLVQQLDPILLNRPTEPPPVAPA